MPTKPPCARLGATETCYNQRVKVDFDSPWWKFFAGIAVFFLPGLITKLKRGRKMEKELAEGQLGPEAKYEVAFKEGALVASLDYQGKVLGAGVVVRLPVSQVVAALKAAIPGKIDDAVLDIIEAALK